jgi:hypothetical protein
MWLPPAAKGEVRVELARLREVFVRELDAAGQMRLLPLHVQMIGRCVGDFVRQAMGRGHPEDYAVARSEAVEEAKRRVKTVRKRVSDLVAALRSLRDEGDPLVSEQLARVQWLMDNTLLYQLVVELDRRSADIDVQSPVHDLLCDDVLTERLERLLGDVGERLEPWTPSPRRGKSARLLAPLVRVYEQASQRPAAANWRGDTPVGPFSAFLVAIYEALPTDARLYAAAQPEAFIQQAKRWLDDKDNSRD